MNCAAGRSDAEIMQMKMEDHDCDLFIGLTAVELANKVGINMKGINLSDMSDTLSREEWEKIANQITTHRKRCEICWHSPINKEFVKGRDHVK